MSDFLSEFDDNTDTQRGLHSHNTHITVITDRALDYIGTNGTGQFLDGYLRIAQNRRAT